MTGFSRALAGLAVLALLAGCANKSGETYSANEVNRTAVVTHGTIVGIREVPVLTAVQREVLNRAHRLAGKGSLIPAEKRYVEQRRVYERHTVDAGLSRMHGLRHAYAQARYLALTGWLSPAAGGPKSRALSTAQREADRNARLAISRELGHEREQVLTVYIGR